MALPDSLRTPINPADHVIGPSQGQWTYAAYAALPDDGHRYEIIDGVLYMSTSPSYEHMRVVIRLIQRVGTPLEERVE